MEGVTTMDNKQLTKLLSYFIMGDGGVYITGNRTVNAKFIMNMKKENQDYIDWVDSVLSTFVGTTQYGRKDYNTDGCVRKEQVRLESKTHPKLTTLRERIYIDSYKGLDPHSLKLLDWEAMAILFMCDGSLVESKLGSKPGQASVYWNLTLNMKRLSYGDQFILKKAIKEILDVEFNINRQNQYYYLRLRGKDVEKFCKRVEPYMKDSFKYKIRMINPVVTGGDIVCSL